MRIVKSLRMGLAVALLAGCGSDAPLDLRYHTPKATVDTLLEAYGVRELEQAEIDRRMRIGRTFHLSDPEAMRGCFSDYEGAKDDGLVGYVFGNAASAKDELYVTITEDTAHAFAERDGERGRPLVLRNEDGRWRISLRESVPRAIRTRLHDAWLAKQGGG